MLVKLDYLLGMAIVVSQLFGSRNLTSAFFYATFFVSAALWLCTMSDGVDRTDALAIFIMVIALVNVLINGALDKTGITFEYLKKYIMFCCTIVFFASASKIVPDSKTIRFIQMLYIAISGLFVLMYFTQNAQMHVIGGYVSGYLTFMFTNPNLAGLFLSCLIMFLLMGCVQRSRAVYRVVLLALAAVDLVFLYQTQARNALLATAVFGILFVFLHALGANRAKIPRWVLACAAVFPLVFALAYLALINGSGVTDFLSFLAGEGKGLGSRVSIWDSALSDYSASPIVGAYSQVSNGIGTSQLHNTHIDILVSYGPAILALVVIFLCALMEKVQTRNRGELTAVALVGFICALFLGLGEAALFSGGLGIYLYAGAFLLAANTPASDGHALAEMQGGQAGAAWPSVHKGVVR